MYYFFFLNAPCVTFRRTHDVTRTVDFFALIGPPEKNENDIKQDGAGATEKSDERIEKTRDTTTTTE